MNHKSMQQAFNGFDFKNSPRKTNGVKRLCRSIKSSNNFGYNSFKVTCWIDYQLANDHIALFYFKPSGQLRFRPELEFVLMFC